MYEFIKAMGSSECLSKIARYLDVKSYLGIGIAEGGCVKAVVENSNVKKLVLCDTWGPYGDEPGRGNHEHIKLLLSYFNFDLNNVVFLDGDSKEKIPEFLYENKNSTFDLVFVDGDHSPEGALADLNNVMNKSKAVLFHDICHIPYLYEVSLEIAGKYKETFDHYILPREDYHQGHGHSLFLRKKAMVMEDEEKPNLERYLGLLRRGCEYNATLSVERAKLEKTNIPTVNPRFRERISFFWNLFLACNYRCPYCWWQGNWHDLVKMNRCLSVDELMKYWENVYSRYGGVTIEISGGEPFLYPNFTELIKELSSIHSIRITTNLSIEIDTFVSQIDSSRVKVSPTFHPLFTNFEPFVKKILLLKENGFTQHISYIAYPPQIKQISHYKERFNQQGLSFSGVAFWGQYKGISYPLGYTEEEREIIGFHLGQCVDKESQLGLKTFKGKLCQAGQIYAVIQADGKVLRCGGSEVNEVIGNFFDENFKLLNEPLPCKSESCECNEWVSLLIR